MWTAWFAIDADGNVAIMECDDNGPAPISTSEDATSGDLIYESLTDEKHKIKYTDEQLSQLMNGSITPQEYVTESYDYENIWGDLCEINPDKLSLLEEAVASNPKNRLICISDTLNLWYVYLSLPHYLVNSGDSRYRPTKKRVEENNRSKELYKKLFEENVFKRMVYVGWPLGYDHDDDYRKGQIEKSDSPMPLYFQNYDYREPAERMHMPAENIMVKESQLSEALRQKAIRLPFRFKDRDRIQVAQYAASHFYQNNTQWEVDGHTAQIVKLPDGKFYFVGDGDYFEPIQIDEAFDTRKTKFKSYYQDYAHEYRINGKRGFLKFGDHPFEIAGSCETYEPKDSDIIERIEPDDD